MHGDQCGDIASDFKIVQLIGSTPEAQPYGKIIDSLFGALNIVRFPPSIHIHARLLQIPASYLEVNAAGLVTGRGLPDRAGTIPSHDVDQDAL